MKKVDLLSKLDKIKINKTSNFLGSEDVRLQGCFLQQVAASMGHYYLDKDTEHYEKHRDAAIIAFANIKPQNEMEGMLAAQMVAGYFASMKCFERASLPDQHSEIRDMYFKHAIKLSRMYIEQMMALNKIRGNGQQKVTVEHIHIHKGGQAIVGNINSDTIRGKNKSVEQAHAKQISYAPEQEMPSPNTKGDKVPVTSDEER